MTMTQTVASDVGVHERARALALVVGESAAFRAFEAAQGALEADQALRSRLAELQERDQQARMSQAWGGADPGEVEALQLAWADIETHPVFTAHAAARNDLLGLLNEVAAGISEGVGIDFGSACAPAGGCCG